MRNGRSRTPQRVKTNRFRLFDLEAGKKPVEAEAGTSQGTEDGMFLSRRKKKEKKEKNNNQGAERMKDLRAQLKQILESGRQRERERKRESE